MTAAAAQRGVQRQMQRAVLRMVQAQGHVDFQVLIGQVPSAVQRDVVRGVYLLIGQHAVEGTPASMRITELGEALLAGSD